MVFVFDLFSKLVDCIGHSLIFLLELVDLIFGFDEVFGVEISVTAYGFIEILLVFALVLYLLVFFL